MNSKNLKVPPRKEATPKLPSSLDELSYNSVKVERAELRNGKIILVIKPSLLSDQVFAVNPYYDEGDKKNQLQEAHFSIKVQEKAGAIKAEASFGNGLNHFTKGHSQIHSNMSNLFKNKIDKAVHEILTTDQKYLMDSERMGKIISNLETQEEKNHAKLLIDNRLEDSKSKNIAAKKESMLKAIGAYEAAVNGVIDEDDDEDFL